MLLDYCMPIGLLESNIQLKLHSCATSYGHEQVLTEFACKPSSTTPPTRSRCLSPSRSRTLDEPFPSQPREYTQSATFEWINCPIRNVGKHSSFSERRAWRYMGLVRSPRCNGVPAEFPLNGIDRTVREIKCPLSKSHRHLFNSDNYKLDETELLNVDPWSFHACISSHTWFVIIHSHLIRVNFMLSTCELKLIWSIIGALNNLHTLLGPIFVTSSSVIPFLAPRLRSHGAEML